MSVIFFHGDRALTTCFHAGDTGRTSDRLCLNEKLDDEAMKILIRSGLEKRFPEPCRKWKHESNAVQSMSDVAARQEREKTSARFQMELPAFRRSLFEAMLDEVMRWYS